jgi:hypothetical protein
LIEIGVVVWFSSTIFALLEAFFIYNPLNYNSITTKVNLALFRLVIMLIFMGSICFGPLVLTTSWNTTVFSFLLNVIHNGFVKETPPEVRMLPEIII